MTRHPHPLWTLCWVLVIFLIHLPNAHATPPERTVVQVPPASPDSGPPVANHASIDGSGVRLGAAIGDGALALYPVFGRTDPRYNNHVGLERALKQGDVEIREHKSKSGQDAAQVNALELHNGGKQPVVVLAGSIVNGGKQDRQVAQDFVVPPGATQNIDAFCVEQGRWDPSRQGKRTAGKFESSAVLAPSSVRRAGQYEHDQGKVWREVAKVNHKHKKTSRSGTLTATYDDRDLRSQTRQRRQRLLSALDALPDRDQVVGLAYAIAGDMRSARWFVTHGLFVEHREKLIDSALMEEATVMADAVAGAMQTPPAPADVDKWIDGQRRSKSTANKRMNRSYVAKSRESKTGHSSSAVHESPGESIEITVDVLAKDPAEPESQPRTGPLPMRRRP